MQLFLLPEAEGPANTQNKMILDYHLPLPSQACSLSALRDLSLS